MHDIVIIPGDGIGPEVVGAARRVLEAVDAPFTFTEMPMGDPAIQRFGTPLPDETVDRVKEADAALKGPVTTPIGSGFRSVNVALRKRLDLYATIRPCTYTPGVASPLRDPGTVDVTVVRENLEDLYAGIEFSHNGDAGRDLNAFLGEQGHDVPTDTGFSIKPISRRETERVIRRGFEYAVREGVEKVAVADKANILKVTDGMWMEIGEAVAAEYDVEYEHILIDNLMQQLVMHPDRFDVVITQNIYGDIASDLAAGLIGGVGVVPSAEVGDETAVFASVHGSAPDIAGEGVANPAAMMFSAALCCDHLDERATGDRIRDAVRSTIKDGPRTADLGGDAGTTEFTDAVVEAL